MADPLPVVSIKLNRDMLGHLLRGGCCFGPGFRMILEDIGKDQIAHETGTALGEVVNGINRLGESREFANASTIAGLQR